MQCPRCQAENRDDLRFCEDCGARLAATCSSCGADVTPGKRFCGGCGAPLGAPAAEPRFTSPHVYTPRHLAEKILTSKAALEGERKQVTVLFADLKGSMELLADRDPEEARTILDPVLELMMDAVHRYEGTVNQVMGDGIMALFGAPLAHEDHAVRACYAALRMQESVKRYADEARRAHGVNVQIRVGLNSGEVVVRAIGSDLHMDYTAIGQTTHLAARMEQLAGPGSSLLTPSTLQLVEGFIAVQPLGPVPVKGLAAAVHVYELTGAGPARTRLQASAARGLTRFVGRDAETAHLRQALEQARSGRGQLVALVGEPGVGKSRLIFELTHSHLIRESSAVPPWRVMESGSISYAKATPYAPLIDLLKGYFRIDARDDTRAIRANVTGNVMTLDESLNDAVAPVLWLLEALPDGDPLLALDPSQRRRRTVEAIRRILLRESRVRPLLLIFEDLHWFDSETQGVLDALVESLPTAPIMLAVSYRPEYQHAWSNKTYYRQLRVDPLPPESAAELLQGLFGDDPSVRPLERLLITRTEGNPFFLEENVRTLVETGVLFGERGSYRLAKPVEDVHVPATVHAVLAARIDRLPSEDKGLLQTAAVIGKDVPFVLLQAIAALPDDVLRRGLTHLQAAEFLYETRLFPDVEYTFKHALTHEVAYGSLVQEQRRSLHARIVSAIEQLHSGRLAEQVDHLGQHAIRGQLWEKAAGYLRQAGARARSRGAHSEAVARYEEALAALQRLPESRESLELAIDLRLDLRNALQGLGELRRGLDYLREAEALAGKLGDRQRLGWVMSYVSNYFWLIGDQDRAIDSGQRALALADDLGDPDLELAANFRLGQACHAVGDYRRAADLLRHSVTSVGRDALPPRGRFGFPFLPPVAFRVWLAGSLAELGEFAEGISRGKEAITIAEAADSPLGLIEVSSGVGFLYLRKGDVDQAIAILERGLDLCRVQQADVWSVRIASTLGAAHVLAGRAAEGVSLLEHAVEQAATIGTMLFHSLRIAHLGEAYLRAGRFDDARGLAMRAVSLAREHKERGHEGWALRLLGDITAHPDQFDAECGEANYHEALALAAPRGMRPLVAHCHLGLGKLYRRTGKRQEAQEHLTTATTMYREMDMHFWLEQVVDEMKEDAP